MNGHPRGRKAALKRSIDEESLVPFMRYGRQSIVAAIGNNFRPQKRSVAILRGR